MNGFILKCIALVTMMIDHTGAVMQPLMDVTLFRVIGRVAFPIYAFFIAEGCRKTHDLEKYTLRLLLFALISEFPFDLVFANVNVGTGLRSILFYDFSEQNVFWTLFLGALSIWTWQAFKAEKRNPVPALCVAGGVISLGYLLRTDYGAAGVFFIFMLYMARRRPLQICCVVVMCFYFYIYSRTAVDWESPRLALAALGSQFRSFSFNAMLFAGGCFSALLICFYNGRRGPNLKWLFYAAYPIHLIILAGVWFFYVSPNR